MDASIARKARLALATDRYFGMESMPVSEIADFGLPIADLQTDPEPAPIPQSAIRNPPSAIPPSPSMPRPTVSAPVAMFIDRTPFASAPLPPEQKAGAMASLEHEHNTQCPHCVPQHKTGLKFVFGDGDVSAAIMFIGEGPGEEEDRQGLPFVGKAGQLLNKQIAAMGLQRSQVYIANVVKTRPPGNRVPTPDEAKLCMPYLERQIEIVRPKAIVALGATAAKYLLDNPALAITKERGQWKNFRGIEVMPTFHPAFLLRSYTEENRRRVWEDLKKVMAKVGLTVPAK